MLWVGHALQRAINAPMRKCEFIKVEGRKQKKVEENLKNNTLAEVVKKDVN